jgi:hypothetical protein
MVAMFKCNLTYQLVTRYVTDVAGMIEPVDAESLIDCFIVK